MANQLDEFNAPVMEQGRDVNVIAKVIPVEATGTEKALPYLIMLVGIIVTIYGLVNDKYIVDAVGIIIFIFPWWQLQQISSEFNMMEQRIQTAASEIDNYMEQRVVILETLENQVKKSIETDKNTFVDIAKYRSGNFSDESRGEVHEMLNKASKSIDVVLENYPELRSQDAIRDAIQQNAYLQREITAARTVYNDAVNTWNREIFEFPFKKVQAAKEGRTTRIPFIASTEIKQRSREAFFNS